MTSHSTNLANIEDFCQREKIKRLELRLTDIFCIADVFLSRHEDRKNHEAALRTVARIAKSALQGD